MSLIVPLNSSGFLLASQAPAASLTAETGLLDQLRNDGPYEQFQTLTRLHQFYFQHRNVGGREGIAWARETHQELIDSVVAEKRYAEFVRVGEETSSARFPREIRPPMVLNFSEEWGRPDVIPIENSREIDPLQRPLAYFSLSALRFLETQMDWNAIDRAQAGLKSGKNWSPITVAYHPNGTHSWAVDALAESLAVYFSGSPYILGRITENSFGAPGRLLREIVTGQQAKPYVTPPIIPIATKLSFVPRRDADFAPVHVTLTRQKRPCPVIIERFLPEDIDLLPTDLREETRHRLNEQKEPDATPFFRALRTLDGEYQAMSLSFLTFQGKVVSLNCKRTVLKDQDRETKIEGIGLAFLVSALRFLKDQGHWQTSGPLLFNIIPRVLNAFRRRAGLSPGSEQHFSLVLDSVYAREGEEFLRKSPLRFEPALSPSLLTPPASTAETVLLDGSPTG